MGRFLSADPQITFPGDLQNYDRYAYVLNNPMASTDPTGLEVQDDEDKRARDLKGQKEWGSIAGMGRNVEVIVYRSSGTSVDHKTTDTKPGKGGSSSNGTFNGLTFNVPADAPSVEGAITGPSDAGAASGMAGSVIGRVLGAVDAVATGGYGARGEQAFSTGNYGEGVAYMAMGTAFGVMNAYTLGSGAVANGFRAVGSEISSAAGSLLARAEALFVSKAEQFGACFTADTPVHTAAGLTPIEDIREGDFVAARDERTGELSWRPVVRLFRNPDQEIVRVSYVDGQGAEETIGATPEHPFRVAGRGWVGAGELQPGDSIVRRDGGSLVIRQVLKDAIRHDTYNFEVAGVHTYFVGSLGAWVHNASVIGNALSKGVQAGEAGSYASLHARRVTGDGLTPHHMPQAGAGRTGYEEGGALMMTHAEHVATRTWGIKGVQTLQQDLGLTFREVLSKDIRDVRQIVGPKYNEGLRDIIDYYRRNFPDLMRRQ